MCALDLFEQSTGAPQPDSDPGKRRDVVGLVGDLGLRPVKGPGFTAVRATAINASGGIEAAFGNPSDCVL